ncbi:MAG TPA: hypothetical protein DDZ51_29200 [Planctomycetaceae bacterium]|nr:hypothetical protein [Planctomycetaceae bacterium]
MGEDGVFPGRNFLHLDVEGHPSFIAACLYRSMPAAGLDCESNWSDELAFCQHGKQRQRTPRESIPQSTQRFTGTRCNRLLGVKGSFWQFETFDPYARD